MICPLRWALIALNFVMNCPGLTPLAPRAGPIGGAGVALPPGAWSLNWLVISFFAMVVAIRLSGGPLLDDRYVYLLASGTRHLGRLFVTNRRCIHPTHRAEQVGEIGSALRL